MKTKRIIVLYAVSIAAGLILVVTSPVEAVNVNGATSDLDMNVTITLSNGCQMTFVPGHGANGAYAYVYTDVGGAIEEDAPGETGWGDSNSYAQSASTSYGLANGSVTVNTAGFDYSIHADGMVQDLGIGDYGNTLSYAYAWPDWLQVNQAGTVTITIDYTYTLDTRDTCDDATAFVYMNAFFANHPGVNYLTAQDEWILDGGSNPSTTTVDHSRSIQDGDYLTVSDSVSWEFDISGAEPENWFSLWAYGEAGVDVMPVPEPATLLLLAIGSLAVMRRRQ